MNKLKTKISVVVTTLTISSNSFAEYITQDITGQFDYVNNCYVGAESSMSSLSLSALVSGSLTYDDTLVSPVGNSYIGHGDGLIGLSLNFGSLSYTETDDLNYGFGYPDAEFIDGALVGIEFSTDYVNCCGQTVWELDMVGHEFQFMDFSSGNLVASGTWQNTSVSAVPVPASVWLFGSGLVGLVGVARRKLVS